MKDINIFDETKFQKSDRILIIVAMTLVLALAASVVGYTFDVKARTTKEAKLYTDPSTVEDNHDPSHLISPKELINEALPSILNDKKPLLKRLWLEIVSYQEYLSVAFRYKKLEPRPYRVAELFTSVVTMLFSIRYAYSVIDPDKGICRKYHDQKQCRENGSSYFQSTCYWDENVHHCFYRYEGTDLFETLLAVSMVSCFIKVVIDVIAKFLFRYYIIPPIASSVRATTQRKMIFEPKQRVSVFDTSAIDHDVSRLQVKIVRLSKILDESIKDKFLAAWGINKSGRFDIIDFDYNSHDKKACIVEDIIKAEIEETRRRADDEIRVLTRKQYKIRLYEQDYCTYTSVIF